LELAVVHCQRYRVLSLCGGYYNAFTPTPLPDQKELSHCQRQFG